MTDTQILALHKRPEGVEVFIFGSDDEPTVTHAPSQELDLGESWEGLDAVLADHAFLGNGGKPIGDVDVGGGPARSLSSAEVATLAKSLLAVSDSELKKRCKKAGDADALRDGFGRLKAFVGAGAAKKLGLVVYLS